MSMDHLIAPESQEVLRKNVGMHGSKEPERKAFHWPNLRQFEPQNKEVQELLNMPLKKIGLRDPYL